MAVLKVCPFDFIGMCVHFRIYHFKIWSAHLVQHTSFSPG